MRSEKDFLKILKIRAIYSCSLNIGSLVADPFISKRLKMKTHFVLSLLATTLLYSEELLEDFPLEQISVLEIKNPKEINGLTIANSADKYIGLPYIWGGTNLKKGVDCSGLLKSIYKQYGFNIPRTAKDQALSNRHKIIKHISKCKIGDALYFKDRKDHIHHVAIISGYEKDGRPIITHAKGKAHGVVRERMSDKYLSEFIGAKRFYIASKRTKIIYTKPLLLKGGGLFTMN